MSKISRASKPEQVQEQYEAFPYPPRNPDDENKRLIGTTFDALFKINTYCFRGTETFDKNFCALVAGAGTGDATIYLAEQLKNKDAQVVHLDLSEHSLEIAKERAKVRGLKNIIWHQASIFDLPKLKCGEFDYINCSGVLHHLEEPEKGLKILNDALKGSGCMGVMLYAKYGRSGVYQLQTLLQLVSPTETPMEDRIEDAKRIVRTIPGTHWFKRDINRWRNDLVSNSGIVDLLLHPIDKPFSVLEIYDLIEPLKLNLVEFVGLEVEGPVGYQIRTYINDKELLEKISKMPLKQQQAICELIVCAQRKHSFYLTKQSNTKATPEKMDLVPVITRYEPTAFSKRAFNLISAGKNLDMQFGNCKISIVPNTFNKYFFKNLNNLRTLNEIFEEMNREAELKKEKFNKQAFLSSFTDLYDQFLQFDCMYLVSSEFLKKNLQSDTKK